jgi:RIO kinase 1
MDKYEAYEKYLELEEEYSPRERAARRAKPRPAGKASKRPDTLAQLTDFVDDPSVWVPSCVASIDPKHHERQWLIESVSPFYRDNVITDVVQRVKSGKEANVYCCTAHPATGVELIAAKLYRPRMLRTLKNDAIYKAGRQLRDEEGKEMKGRREKLALRQKTRFGQNLDMTWWIGNEFRVQSTLFEAGANVPRPIGHNGNTILMDYVGDESLPAPTLSDVSLARDEARGLFRLVIDNIRLMLENHCVHGDLSAYNILYWEEAISIIDFPQVVDARSNPNARVLLQRDVKRVCGYFARFKVESDPERIVRDLWIPYMGSY